MRNHVISFITAFALIFGVIAAVNVAPSGTFDEVPVASSLVIGEADAHYTCYEAGGCRVVYYEDFGDWWCDYNGGPIYQWHLKGYEVQFYDAYAGRWYYDHHHNTHWENHYNGSYCY